MRMSFTPHVKPRNPRVIVLLSVLVILLSGAAAIVGGPYLRRAHEKRTANLPSEAELHAARKRVVLQVAPAPLPTALPLLGPDGRDGEGYPLKYVDRPAFRSFLAHGDYAALNRSFDQLQAAFEADPRMERWPMSAADAVRLDGARVADRDRRVGHGDARPFRAVSRPRDTPECGGLRRAGPQLDARDASGECRRDVPYVRARPWRLGQGFFLSPQARGGAAPTHPDRARRAARRRQAGHRRRTRRTRKRSSSPSALSAPPWCFWIRPNRSTREQGVILPRPPRSARR